MTVQHCHSQEDCRHEVHTCLQHKYHITAADLTTTGLRRKGWAAATTGLWYQCNGAETRPASTALLRLYNNSLSQLR